MEERSGSKLEDFRLMGKLGEGTFSEVLKVKHKKSGAVFAMKRFRKHFKSHEEIENLREIQALRRLNPHMNVVDLEDVIFDPKHGILSLNFPLMDCNLYELISKKHTVISETKAKVYFWQICKGLEYMHGKGIFHRDIKPENILVLDNFIKLADFGSCRGIHSKPPFTEYIATRWYRSPECLLCEGMYSYKMDIWGAGCVLFEIISKVPLFPGSNELDQLHRIHGVMGTPNKRVLQHMLGNKLSTLKYNFPPTEGTGIKGLIPHSSPECVDLITLMLAYDPEDRITAKDALKHAYFRDAALLELGEPYLESVLGTGGAKVYLSKVRDQKVLSGKRRIEADSEPSYSSNVQLNTTYLKSTQHSKPKDLQQQPSHHPGASVTHIDARTTKVSISNSEAATAYVPAASDLLPNQKQSPQKRIEEGDHASGVDDVADHIEGDTSMAEDDIVVAKILFDDGEKGDHANAIQEQSTDDSAEAGSDHKIDQNVAQEEHGQNAQSIEDSRAITSDSVGNAANAAKRNSEPPAEPMETSGPQTNDTTSIPPLDSIRPSSPLNLHQQLQSPLPPPLQPQHTSKASALSLPVVMNPQRLPNQPHPTQLQQQQQQPQPALSVSFASSTQHPQTYSKLRHPSNIPHDPAAASSTSNPSLNGGNLRRFRKRAGIGEPGPGVLVGGPSASKRKAGQQQAHPMELDGSPAGAVAAARVAAAMGGAGAGGLVAREFSSWSQAGLGVIGKNAGGPTGGGLQNKLPMLQLNQGGSQLPQPVGHHEVKVSGPNLPVLSFVGHNNTSSNDFVERSGRLVGIRGNQGGKHAAPPKDSILLPALPENKKVSHHAGGQAAVANQGGYGSSIQGSTLPSLKPQGGAKVANDQHNIGSWAASVKAVGGKHHEPQR